MEKYGVVDPGTTPTQDKTNKTANAKPRCPRGCSLKASKEKEKQLDKLDDDVAKRMATEVKEKCPKGPYSL